VKTAIHHRNEMRLSFLNMAEQIGRAWWKHYCRTLEDRFQQRQIIIRLQDASCSDPSG
jgi:hypothetical protein